MASQTIGIIVNGATGRIGSTQHLANALIPIIAEGGLALGHDQLVPRLLLTGRDAERLAAVARAHNVADWSTDLDAALADPAYAIFFDAAATQGRVAVLEKALAAGKHVYCEKPVASTAAHGLALLRAAQRRGLKHGVVEDKIHLPGLQKLAALTKGGELGRVVGFRLEFGWWVFDGSAQPCQRPSWNYRAGGGGMILDMYPHWRYVIESIVGRIVRVASSAWIATPERVDERGERYGVAVEDSAATLIELEGGAFGTIVSSCAPRRPSHAAGRRKRGLGGRGLASMPRAVDDAHAGDRPFQRDARHRRRLPRGMDASAAARALPQPLPRRLGSVPAACGRRRAACVRLRGRHSRRRIRGRLPSQHAGAHLDCISAARGRTRAMNVPVVPAKAGTHIPEAGDHGFPLTRERQQANPATREITPRRRICRSPRLPAA